MRSVLGNQEERSSLTVMQQRQEDAAVLLAYQQQQQQQMLQLERALLQPRSVAVQNGTFLFGGHRRNLLERSIGAAGIGQLETPHGGMQFQHLMHSNQQIAALQSASLSDAAARLSYHYPLISQSRLAGLAGVQSPHVPIYASGLGNGPMQVSLESSKMDHLVPRHSLAENLASPKDRVKSQKKSPKDKDKWGGLPAAATSTKSIEELGTAQILNQLGRTPRSKEDGYTDVTKLSDLDSEGVKHVLFCIEGRGGVKEAFPSKLHRMLLEKQQSGIAGFLPHGRAFRIYDAQRFEDEIMPKYFSKIKYKSFIRQLHLYGFQRINESDADDKGGYYHELFLRDYPKICKFMRRLTVKGMNRDRRRRGFETTIDFDAISTSKDTGDKKPKAIEAVGAPTGKPEASEKESDGLLNEATS